MKKIELTDLNYYTRTFIKDSNFDLMEFPGSIPGEGFSHMLIDCSYDPFMPLALHLVKYVYACTPNHKNTTWIYNDIDGQNKWTVTPYATHHIATSRDDYYAFHLIPEQPLYLSDFELNALLHWALRKDSYKSFIQLDPAEIWGSLVKDVEVMRWVP